MLLVHVKLKKIKLTELELTAIAGANKDNADKIVEVLESYRRQIFPGMEEKKDKSMEVAKQQLAAAVQEVFIMKPLGDGESKALQDAASSNNPDIARWANQELRKREIDKGPAPTPGISKPLPRGIKPQKR